jgi:hypothetical protein
MTTGGKGKGMAVRGGMYGRKTHWLEGCLRWWRRLPGMGKSRRGLSRCALKHLHLHAYEKVAIGERK